MTNKVANEDGSVDNGTGTELEILKNIEKSFYNQNTGSVKRNTMKSLEWFRKYVPRSYNKVRTARIFRDRKLWADHIRVGNLYTFTYDALNKETLPVWDAQPLVFFFDEFVSKGGNKCLLGINLHFLSPAARLIAFKSLLKTKNEKRFRKSTRLKISWDILKSLSGSKYFEHSVRMYRVDHIESKFVKIPPSSWELILFLPIARWRKGSNKEAWKL